MGGLACTGGFLKGRLTFCSCRRGDWGRCFLLAGPTDPVLPGVGRNTTAVPACFRNVCKEHIIVHYSTVQ